MCGESRRGGLEKPEASLVDEDTRSLDLCLVASLFHPNRPKPGPLGTPGEAVTILVPSPEADSICSTLAFPALPCRAFSCRRFAADTQPVPPLVLPLGFITDWGLRPSLGMTEVEAQRPREAAEKVESVTSAAEAAHENKVFIAALKRCATQNQPFSRSLLEPKT